MSTRRSPPSSDRNVMAAFSQWSLVTDVKSSASSPGSRCGNTWRSAFDPSAVVTVVDAPPCAETFEMPVPDAKKIVPSPAHVAPHPTPDTSAIVSGGPPAAGTFLIVVLPSQNPIQLPSGEKNGPPAPSVPDNGFAATASSART